MKTQITAITNIEGRTVQFATQDPREGFVIAFTDESFVWLKMQYGYDDNSWYACDKEIKIDDFDDETLIAIGLYTQPELDAIRAEERRKSQESKERRDQLMYEQLKRKYEPKE